MNNFDVPTLMRALRKHPVPLAHLIQLRDVVTQQSGKENFLFAACRDAEEDGSKLADPELARALAGVALGQWPMGVAAIDLWAARILERKPSAILEFGSGVSTVVGAMMMRRIHGGDRVRVFSIEQGEDAAAATRSRLESLGLSSLVKIHIAPMQVVLTDAFESDGYGIQPNQMDEFFNGAKPELVLIDGPFGGYGARFSTLPSVHSWLAINAEIWMDDALRDSELAIAHWWTELGYLEKPSLQFIAKGIARGYRGHQPKAYRMAADVLRKGEVTGDTAEYLLLKMRLQSADDQPGSLRPPFKYL